MQVIAEFLTAFVVWLAAAVLSQFGIEVDIDHKAPPSVERVVEAKASPAAHPLSDDCPQARAKVSRAPLDAV